MMDSFSQLKNSAEDCLSRLNNGFCLKETDAKERKIIFANESVTFSIVCPETEDGTDWNIWSQNESVYTYLPDLIEYVNSPRQKSLAEIIEKVCHTLAPLVKGNEMEAREEEKKEDDDDEDDDEEDDDDDDYGGLMEDGYYQNEDRDAIDDEAPVAEGNEEDNIVAQYAGGQGPTRMAVSRLVRDMKAFENSEVDLGIIGKPREDNLFFWDVKLTGFDVSTQLGRDLQNYAKKYNKEPVIYMELMFPPDYPMAPPFARVIRPRFQFLTGHVTMGGSVCMELLTKSGWSPSNTIESILVQIRSEIMSDPNAQLDHNPDRDYGLEEAKTAFLRAAQKYGWDK